MPMPPCVARGLHLSGLSCQKKEKKSLSELLGYKGKFRKVFVKEEDLNKRPSDLEIKRKDLPPETPTLGERINRDYYHLFHQRDEKAGYHNLRKYPSVGREIAEEFKEQLRSSPTKMVKDSFKVLRGEVAKYREELGELRARRFDHLATIPTRPGDRRVEWDFSSQEQLKQWVLTVDSDWGEGYSAGGMSLGGQGRHLTMAGELSTRVPQDGRTQRAGYVNLHSVKKRKSFGREELMDWQSWTHLTLNIRGDGRKYNLHIQVKRDFDIHWNDRWTYPLFTRGGPYWQYVKIPWSKFLLTSKGSIQDKQHRVPLEHGVVGLGITLADGISGPFQLEIKDIGLMYEPTSDDEEFAYEMYKIPPFWAHH